MTVRVLVVDDEPDIELLFRQQFRREVREGRYVLDFAHSGQTALDMLDGFVGGEIMAVMRVGWGTMPSVLVASGPRCQTRLP